MKNDNESELAQALKAILDLPYAKKALEYLHKGIGTNTRDKAWLDAEKALRKFKEVRGDNTD